MTTLVLRGVTLSDGSTADVHVAADAIAAVLPAGSAVPSGSDVVELGGHLLLPSFVEPHAHLDKAFLAETIPNPTGDLIGAIEAMETHRDRLSHADTVARACRAVDLLLANGVTAIRTHADTVPDGGLAPLEALLDVRERYRGTVDVQVVAMAGWVATGDDPSPSRALARAAVAAGADVLGGCPHLEDRPAEATDWLLELAGERGLAVDLHTDETLDPGALHLEYLAQRVLATGFDQPVTASHCVSLGVQPEARQHEVAAVVAAAGIGVVCLPHTNLFLQGRSQRTATPRGLTAVGPLRAAGVPVAAGADNLQDPFNPVGRGDPLETAGLMIIAAHLLPAAALDAVTADARHVLGLPPVAVRPGDPADLVAVPAATVREAIAMGPPGRVVVRAGRMLGGAGRPQISRA